MASMSMTTPVLNNYMALTGRVVTVGRGTDGSIRPRSPDGDSMRFLPDNLDLLARSARRRLSPVDYSSQLRLKIIDALETHYKGKHQPFYFANQATDVLLKIMGVTNPKWEHTDINADRGRLLDANDGMNATILCQKIGAQHAVDPYGRPIALLYPGRLQHQGRDVRNGDCLPLTEDLFMQSANMQLLLQGLVYMTAYENTPPEIRAVAARIAQQVRLDKTGLMAVDRTLAGAEIFSMADVESSHVMLPKLARRLFSYLMAQDSYESLLDYLKANPDPVFLAGADFMADSRTAQVRQLHEFVEVNGNSVRMTVPPEQLVCKEKG